MSDKLGLLDLSVSLQVRYDHFLKWLSSKNHAISEFMAEELGLSVSEVDVFEELGNLEEDEFAIIDSIGFDIGLLFIIVRAPVKVRRFIYSKSAEIFESPQPLTFLKEIVDRYNCYSEIRDLVEKITGKCWISLAGYLKQRNIQSGTINTGIRKMLFQVGRNINAGRIASDKQYDWIVRAIYHDVELSIGVFTNESIKNDYCDDYKVFMQIREYILRNGSE